MKPIPLALACLTVWFYAASPGWAETRTFGPIKPGNNLWTIARQIYAGEGVSREQIALALLKASPHAFGKPCNVYSALKLGETLRIPPLSEIKALSRAEAHREFVRQEAQWRAYRKGRKEITCPPAATLSTTPVVPGEAITPSPIQKPAPTPPPEVTGKAPAVSRAPSVTAPSPIPPLEREVPAEEKRSPWLRVAAGSIAALLVIVAFLIRRPRAGVGAKGQAVATAVGETRRLDFEKLSVADTLSTLGVQIDRGLSAGEAARRLEQYGANLMQEKEISALSKFLGYFWGPIPWMIEVAALLSAVVRHWDDFAIIVTMLLVNAGVGFWQEYKADNAIALLKQRLALKARVLREEQWQDLPASRLVPGDVILLKLGDIVPADAKLLEGEYLSVDQSALTGESLPVDKKAGDAVYSGSIAKLGEMRAVVTATGMQTYFGKTAALVEKAGVTSHFQRAVLRIGNFLILITLALVALILVVALFRHDPLAETLLFALILTVAAIPVALPAVLSVTMAVGAERLARMKAIVSRLVAIEETAGMDVLCSDKTGTLTKNQLTLGEPVVIGARDTADLILAAALASEAGSNDAIDLAVLHGLPDPAALEGYRVLNFHTFDPIGKRSEAEVQRESDHFKVAKGAPQVILDLTQPDGALRQTVTRQVEALAAKGYRTLGVARTDLHGQWQFLGLLPLFDPPRDDSAATIEAAKAMGLEIKMVTGDHLAIAKQIAGQLHLGQNILPADQVFGKEAGARDKAIAERADGFAQVFPEHKLEIVEVLQAKGHIVGMTGDGVNDAPALKQADVGIAVSGATDAARAAADLVLTEAGLSVISRAIEESRRIFERMNSYAIYRIAETIRVLLFMTLSILVFNFYPVTAVMIVLIALLNDFPIMMIAYDNAPAAQYPVRWDMHRVLSVSLLLGILGVISSFGLFWIGEEYLHLPRDTIQTLLFLKLLVAGHLTIFLTRSAGAVWQKPYPSWSFFSATMLTKILGTLAAVYGWFVQPIGWNYALLVWGYALAWFLVNDRAKISAYKLIEHRIEPQAYHLSRIEAPLHPSA